VADENVIRPTQFQGPSSGAPSDGSDISIKDYVDSRDDAVESRLTQKLDKLSTKGTIWAAMATAVGIVFAAWAIAGDRFDAGMSISPVVTQMQNSQAAVDREQNAKLDLLDDKLDILLERTAGNAANANESN
jgi:hypothetical protein